MHSNLYRLTRPCSQYSRVVRRCFRNNPSCRFGSDGREQSASTEFHEGPSNDEELANERDSIEQKVPPNPESRRKRRDVSRADSLVRAVHVRLCTMPMERAWWNEQHLVATLHRGRKSRINENYSLQCTEQRRIQLLLRVYVDFFDTIPSLSPNKSLLRKELSDLLAT